jgi:type III pantothenate kinase
MNLVLDIGNSGLKAGWFDGNGLTGVSRHDSAPHDTLEALIGSRPVDAVLVSSVGSADRQTFASFSGAVKQWFFLEPSLPLPLTIRYSTPETLGKDRIAAAAGACMLFPNLPLLVIDLGTAITIDFVSAEGEFRGGNISPGMKTRFRALHEFTARLPLVEKDGNWPDFGNDTRTAITAGVQQGILHELDGYMHAFAVRFPQCRFMLTGGDAVFFADRFKKPIFADPDLVLKGLNHILEFNLHRNAHA